MSQFSPLEQMQRAMKKKSPIDVNSKPPLTDQNATFNTPPTLNIDNSEFENSSSAGAASGLLGALSQVGQDMSKPMQVWQTPDWMQNQGAIYKAQAPQQTPPYQAGSELGNSALL